MDIINRTGERTWIVQKEIRDEDATPRWIDYAAEQSEGAARAVINNHHDYENHEIHWKTV